MTTLAACPRGTSASNDTDPVYAAPARSSCHFKETLTTDKCIECPDLTSLSKTALAQLSTTVADEPLCSKWLLAEETRAIQAVIVFSRRKSSPHGEEARRPVVGCAETHLHEEAASSSHGSH
ncbi:hypothetical protein GCM10009626_07770 [Brachybacterium sacelli]